MRYLINFIKSCFLISKKRIIFINLFSKFFNFKKELFLLMNLISFLRLFFLVSLFLATLFKISLGCFLTKILIIITHEGEQKLNKHALYFIRQNFKLHESILLSAKSYLH